jgi:hypothetical protein
MASPDRRATADRAQGGRLAAAFAVAVMSAACVKSAPVTEPVGVTGGDPSPLLSKEAAFAFDSLDERPVTSDAARGKIGVLVFVTTWDLTSQAQVNYLNAMVKNDGDKVFYAVVAVQEGSSKNLVAAYARSLSVTCPVAVVDPVTLNARAPFGEIRQVPTVVVLDRAGKIAWMRTGLAKAEEVRQRMNNL